MATKPLVLGGGFLGSQFAQYFKVDVYTHQQVDIVDYLGLKYFLQQLKPSVVINAAGATNTHEIEKPENRTGAFQANVQGPLNLALLSRELGFKLVQLSSGMLYDGHKLAEKEFTEVDVPRPLSYYAWTKAWMEAALLPYIAHDILILRVHLPFAGISHPKNLLTKMQKFSEMVDEPSSMTSVEELLEATGELLEKEAAGIFNVVNQGQISFMQIAQIMKETGLIKDEIVLTSVSKDTLAQRIKEKGGATQVYPALSSAKLAELGITLSPIDQAIRQACLSLNNT